MASLTEFSNSFFDFNSLIFFPYRENATIIKKGSNPNRLDKIYSLLGNNFKVLTNVLT